LFPSHFPALTRWANEWHRCRGFAVFLALRCISSTALYFSLHHLEIEFRNRLKEARDFGMTSIFNHGYERLRS